MNKPSDPEKAKVTSSILESSMPLLAYFSHSYHPSEKELNLFFWELLSKHRLYFTIDSVEENRDKPMDISYLEWMMRRSACFVAVIPRRDNLQPYNCSPYQVFENGLAIRARKPRLIFVEEGLDSNIFGFPSDEICSFNRTQELLDEKMNTFVELVERLVLRARAFSYPTITLRKPVALLADATQGTVYNSDTVKRIRQVVRNQGYWFRTINPTEFEQDFLFFKELEEYSLLISEVQSPYVRPEILGLVHGRCIPTIRICHIEKDEAVEEVQAAMRLSIREGVWSDKDSNVLPLIFSKYQIDKDMEPIIFWEDIKDLEEKLRTRLIKIAKKRDDLVTEQDARDYFLRIGRLRGQLFISNPQSQNDFVYELKKELKRDAVDWFHYKDKGAIRIGSENWLSNIITEIRNSIIFVAIIDSNYTSSEWCMSELEEALDLYYKGEIEIHAYVVDKDAPLPDDLSLIQVSYLETFSMDEKIERIVENSVISLETGKQVALGTKDKDHTVTILAELPCFAFPNECKMLLKEAGLPDHLLRKIRTDAQTSKRAVEEIVNDLSHIEEDVKPRTKALGLFLSYTMGVVDSIEDQRFIADMIRNYRLLPGIKQHLEPRQSSQEIGLVYFHEGKEIGIFQSINEGTLVEPKFAKYELNLHLYAQSVKDNAEKDTWQKRLLSIGDDLFRKTPFGEELFTNYRNLIETQGIPHEQIEFCFATDERGFHIPFEWAIIEGQASPLCLRHPVRRFLEGCPKPNPTIREMLEGKEAVPLRILLTASNTGDIVEVDNEIDQLYSMFCKLFESVGWPTSNICKLNSEAATPDRIEEEIREGNYHIFHFAGHGDYENVKPVLKVWADEKMESRELISATKLRNWISDSDLRFVYISSCRSASTQILHIDKVIQNFENIAHAIVQAHVPEVIGFVWPIEDRESKLLAQRFYKNFLKGFNTSLSLYHARTSFEEENRIWASPVLIQQSDT